MAKSRITVFLNQFLWNSNFRFQIRPKKTKQTITAIDPQCQPAITAVNTLQQSTIRATVKNPSKLIVVPQAKIGGLLLVQDQPALQNETHLKQNKQNPISQDRYFF